MDGAGWRIKVKYKMLSQDRKALGEPRSPIWKVHTASKAGPGDALTVHPHRVPCEQIRP